MTRLQKKCFIASAGMHLLLVVILFIGPGFLSRENKADDVAPLTFVPDMLLDANRQGGGNPKARPPSPLPPRPSPAVTAQSQQDSPKVTAKESPPEKPDPESFEVTNEHKQHKQFVLTQVTRRPTPTTQTKTKPNTSSDDSAQRQWSETKQKLASQLGHAAESINDNTSSAVETGSFGPSGGGPSYAGYESWVLTVYRDAWVVPDDATSEDVVTTVSVTIASDGRVISSRIVGRSGDAAVDASVQRTLDRVTSIGRPFPAGARDKQRSYKIPFNLKVKRGSA